jgi:pimeloyl-ACP methyl ester carboxylesterase
MTPNDYSILTMLQRRMARAAARREPFPREPEALRRRLSRTREQLLHCLGTMPDAVVAPETRVEAAIPLAETGVIQERIVYRTEEDVWVPAHVYRPGEGRDEPLPGVLLLQGWDLDKHTLPAFKVRLAQAGNVVLFPDNRFSGERRRAADGQTEQANLLPVAGLFGLTFLGMNTWDNQRALDVLAARPDVRSDRLGVVGLCWGGMQAWLLAALDERVRAACPVCAVSTYEAMLRDFIPWTSGHSCYGTYLWNWTSYGDVQDIIACIAPRPLLIQNNLNDTWFPAAGYADVVRDVAGVYETFGAEENFRHEARLTQHDITQEFGDRVIDWLYWHLSREGGRSSQCGQSPFGGRE